MASLYLLFSATCEFHTEYEPFNHPFSLVQITVKTACTMFSLLQLEVSLEHRLVVGGELFHGGWGTLGLFGWGCASGTLEALAYTYTYTRAAQPPPPPQPPLSSVAVFQKLLKSLAKFSQNKTDLLFLYFSVAIPSFPNLESNLQPIDQFPGK